EARPDDATTDALPALTAVTMPAASTVATDGLVLRHVTRSGRLSPDAENARPTRRRRWPATSFTVAGSISIDAAGPGSARISTVSNFGRAPASVAVTMTGSVLVEPAVTSPSVSTRPSKRAPLARR